MRRWLAAVWLLFAWTCQAQELHLKARTLRPVTGDADELSRALSDTSSVHKIIQFAHPPGQAELDAVAANGVSIVAALPDNALVVSAPGGQAGKIEGAVWAGRLEPEYKLSPLLGQGEELRAIVEFHADVSPEMQETVAGSAGITLLRRPLLQPNHALIVASKDALSLLARYDEVAYIFPADPGLEDPVESPNLLACAGMVTTSGVVSQYAVIVHGWDLDPDRQLHLKYLFGSVTPKVPQSGAQQEVVRAFNEWSRAGNVTFTQSPSPAGTRTILIRFVSGTHGDAYPFDGPKGSLAHTYYPVPVNAETIAGDMHLDADENWHIGGDVDIYSVALHEAGHALGLGHSDKPGDVMYPYYRSRQSLSANDVTAIQKLYGAPSGESSGSAPITDPSATPTLKLTLNAYPNPTQQETAALTGSLVGGVAPVSVQWQTAAGGGGKGSVNSATWTASGIPLSAGDNTITISAWDAAQHTAAATATITRQAPVSSGTQPLSVSVRTPASSVTSIASPTLNISGIAAGGNGVVRVAWQTSAGAAGTANGAATWQASGIPLLLGVNTIVVRAWDAKGASAWASLVVTRR